MAFTEKKFRALPFASQAKKIADLIAACASNATHIQRGGRLAEIARLQNFAIEAPEAGAIAAPPGLPAPDSVDFERDLYRAYIFWRNAAGLGAEREVLNTAFARRPSVSSPADRDHARARGPAIDYSVWLHDIRSGFNVGAVLRTAECFGFRRAYLSGFTPGPGQAAVRSAAMGCESWIECVRFARTTTMPRPPRSGTLIALESPNTPLPAHARCRTITPYSEFNWPQSAVIAVGNEELGLDSATLAEADAILSIPLFGRKASLNLASAFAIVAAHARQIIRNEDGAQS